MNALEAVNSCEDGLKCILSGPAGSGKTTMLLSRYTHLVEKLKVPSEKVLILLLNRSNSLDWRSKTLLKKSGDIWRTSYYGFVQNELSTYYPLVLSDCRDIEKKSCRPVFLTFEAAQFLVSKVIESRRMTNGIFNGVTSTSDRIAIDLTFNLVKAATNGIAYNEIGQRLYDALDQKNDVKKQIYKDADDILEAYRRKCFKLGILDFGMAVEVYNNILLKNRQYIELLGKRVEHLIVDDLEESVPAEIDLIETLLPHVRTCLISYNPEGGYGEMFGSSHLYAAERIAGKLINIPLEKPLLCNPELEHFADGLFKKIRTGETPIFKGLKSIERSEPVELRSEMLEKTGERIVSLVKDEGYKPQDIALLSTYADPVTEFVIERILEKEGIKLKNIARKSKVLDNPFQAALITLAELCHPSYNIYPSKTHVKSLLKMLLKLDAVRSSLLAGEICSRKPFAQLPDVEFPGLVERIGYYNVDKYEYVRQWIEDYIKTESPLPLNEFFQKVFLEILISEKVSEDDILKAKNLIDSSSNFYDVVARFNRNAGKDFLKLIRSGAKSSESIFELEEQFDNDAVIMATPVSFLTNPLKSKVTVITSLSSSNWAPRSVKELTNIHVLNKCWNPSEIYTEEIEMLKQSEYLSVIMRAIIKKTGEKLITFESDLSSNGFENDGILSEYFGQMLIN